MKFKDLTKKIRKVWGKRFNITSQVRLERFRDATIKKYIQFSKKQLFKKIHRFDTDWETLDANHDESKVYKAWDITFDKFPKKFLPHIRIQFLWKSTETISSDPDTNHIFKVENENVFNTTYTDKTTVLNLRLLAGIQFPFSGNAPQIKAKLLIILINPENFN